MIKHFCDLCGKPAMVLPPVLRVDFPEQTWIGVKTAPGSISCVEGEWTPHVTAKVIFEFHDTPRSSRTHDPDVCEACVADLLYKMANGLIKPTLPEPS